MLQINKVIKVRKKNPHKIIDHYKILDKFIII